MPEAWSWPGARVLVTGGSGFLGSHLVRRLVGLGASVTAWSGSAAHEWRLSDLAGRVHLSVVDLRHPAAVEAAVAAAAPQVVFHMAAYGVQYRDQDALAAVDVNVRGTATLLTALRPMNCRRIVTTGTWAEYRPKAAPLTEEDPVGPAGVYACTKAAASLMALGLAGQYGLPLIVLRPFSIFGPGEDEEKFVPAVIRALVRGEQPRLTACTQIRDYLYVEDLVTAYVQAVEAGCPMPSVINIGSGRGLALKDLVAGIQAEVPGPVAFGALPPRPQEVPHVVAEASRAAQWLGWHPSWTLADGLRATVAWYRDRETLASATQSARQG